LWLVFGKSYQLHCQLQFLFGVALGLVFVCFVVSRFLGYEYCNQKVLITKKFQGYFSMLIYLYFVDLIFAGVVFVCIPVVFNFLYSLFAMVIGLLPL
jgi:hypothetical protein